MQRSQYSQDVPGNVETPGLSCKKVQTYGAGAGVVLRDSFRVCLHPQKRRTRAFYRGSGGGARDNGFEERVGAHARIVEGHFL